MPMSASPTGPAGGTLAGAGGPQPSRSACWDDTQSDALIRTRNSHHSLLLVPSLRAASRSAARRRAAQVALFQDDALLVERGAGVRDATLDELRGARRRHDQGPVALGLRSRRAAGASPPASTARSRRIPRLAASTTTSLAAAQARGFQVMLAPRRPAPELGDARQAGPLRASTGRARASSGASPRRPARRFPGVDVWTLWNEPNQAKFLYPAVGSRGVPRAPHVYRAHGARRGGRPAPRRRNARPGAVRRAAADRGQALLLRQGQPPAAPLPARVLLPRLLLPALPRPRRPRARLPALQEAHRPRRLRLPPLHAARRARPGGALARRRHDPLARARDRRARPRPRARADRRRPAADLDHRVRLPVRLPPDPQLGVRLARIPGFMALSELWLARRNRARARATRSTR